jgi:hypothetical protein
MVSVDKSECSAGAAEQLKRLDVVAGTRIIDEARSEKAIQESPLDRLLVQTVCELQPVRLLKARLSLEIFPER